MFFFTFLRPKHDFCHFLQETPPPTNLRIRFGPQTPPQVGIADFPVPGKNHQENRMNTYQKETQHFTFFITHFIKKSFFTLRHFFAHPDSGIRFTVDGTHETRST